MDERVGIKTRALIFARLRGGPRTSRDLRICLTGIAATMIAFADGSPVLAQDVVFDPAPTADCLSAAEMAEEKRACIGRAADVCVDVTPGGQSTVGMGTCLAREHQWWDARLNRVYGEVVAKARANDAEMAKIGSSAGGQEDALRGMQRAWLSFRDGKCSYEATLWQGGTGAGPAYAACQMRTTAEQVLFLEEAGAW